jgi:flagellar hook protein FlgE
MGNNLWEESSASGQPLVGTPNAGAMGSLNSSALEDSNVDLTSELVQMIVAQRVYQANAQSIKTQDAVLQTLVNLR